MMTSIAASVQDAAAIRVDRLGKRYPRVLGLQGTSWALQDCTFQLAAGQVAALVGANGAGKTTLLGLLAGVLRPTHGQVRVGGAAVTAARVALVAQGKPLYRQFTATDLLRFGAHLNRTWDQQRALRWLDRFAIPLDRACGRLSEGQRAQVAFAVALGSRPSILLLDEPLANLDPLVRAEVTSELLTEVHDTGVTVLLSTHVVGEIVGVADHLLLLAHGRLLLDEDLDRLLREHVHYLGPRSDSPPGPGQIVRTRSRDNQSSFLVRLPAGTPPPVLAPPWTTRPVTLDDLVLAMLAATRPATEEVST